MVTYDFPLGKKETEELSKKYPTPFHLYDERSIRNTARKLYSAFSWVNSFKNYYAVKALPNPFILRILKEEGMGADCSSLAELMLAEKIGITGEDILFSANDTPEEEFVLAKKLGAIINLDDFGHIAFLEKSAGLPELVSLRYNPGSLKGGNSIIGKPEAAKFGLTKEQMFDGYALLKKKGVKRFGLHTMLASNERNAHYHVETARLAFELVAEVKEKIGVVIEFVDLGGGYGIPYRPTDSELNLMKISDGVRDEYETHITKNGLAPLRVCMEHGRYITGPSGWLVSRVIHHKHTYRDYLGMDASMSDLMRPGMYGAYHHITVLGKEGMPLTNKYDVTGSLCENNDKFAVERMLPEVAVGDLLVIHNTGAHGHAMGFNYNGKLRHAELLLRENGEIVQIRRPETVEDHFSTLDFKSLKSFDP